MKEGLPSSDLPAKINWNKGVADSQRDTEPWLLHRRVSAFVFSYQTKPAALPAPRWPGRSLPASPQPPSSYWPATGSRAGTDRQADTMRIRTERRKRTGPETFTVDGCSACGGEGEVAERMRRTGDAERSALSQSLHCLIWASVRRHRNQQGVVEEALQPAC